MSKSGQQCSSLWLCVAIKVGQSLFSAFKMGRFHHWLMFNVGLFGPFLLVNESLASNQIWLLVCSCVPRTVTSVAYRHDPSSARILPGIFTFSQCCLLKLILDSGRQAKEAWFISNVLHPCNRIRENQPTLNLPHGTWLI